MKQQQNDNVFIQDNAYKWSEIELVSKKWELLAKNISKVIIVDWESIAWN